MHIHSDRRDAFDVAPAELWQAMEQVHAYRRWWPWLRELEATALAPGAIWTAVVQPPLPYRVRFDIRITEVQPGVLVRAQVTGDIVGSAHLEIAPTPTGSELRLVSDLAPEHRVLRAVAQVAGPVVRLGHQWVLDTGVRQFRDRALA